MSLPKFTVSHPVSVAIVFILLIALGIYASLDLAIDLYPEISPPVLLVFTNYSGTGPDEIEKTITRPLESALSNVGNIDKILSVSSEGSSQITIRFTYGTNMTEAANDVRDKIEFIKKYLPEGAETPTIFKFDPSMIPILNLLVKGNRTPEEIRKISEDIITPRIEQVQGVSMASVSGGRERLIRVEIDQNRLEAYNLTLTQISNMLRGQNIQISAGSITEGNKNYLVRTSGEYSSIEEIKNTVVAYKGGGFGNTPTKIVRLRDIANIYDGLKKEENAIYVNGNPAVYIIVQKQSGTNSVKTADNVLARLKKIQKEVPYGIEIEVINNSTKIIKSSLNSVVNAVLSGAILAILILFLFLRSFKSVTIIGVAIPISVVITLMLMYFFNLTLNIMTLSGLALGIGMLVDNSIVILENIYRYREKGAKHTVASIIGSEEMMGAITGSTLTTVVVFVPVIMFKNQLGMIGELFASLAFVVVISLLCSLGVAVLLVPVLTSKYLKINTRLEEPLSGPFKVLDDMLENFWSSLSHAYEKALKFILRHRKITIIVIFLTFVGSLILIPVAGFEFMPQSDEDSVTLNVELPIGTSLDITKGIMSQIELVVRNDVKGFKDIIVRCGEKGFFGFLGATESHKGSIMITLPDYKDRIDTSSVVKEKLRKYFNDFTSVKFKFGGGMMRGRSSSPIDVLIKSNDTDKAKVVAEKIRDIIIKKIPEIREPLIDLKDGLPQIEIKIDRDKAYSLGLNIYNIGQEIRANIDGVTASKFREGGSEYDILLISSENDRDALPDLEKIFVMNQSGIKVPLSNFAYFEKTTGPVKINRENQMRVIHVTGGLAPKVKLNEVEAKLRMLIKEEIPQDDSIIIDFSGDFAELMKYGMKFIMILIIAMALVFGVMAAQFESFLDPFIIFFTMPLTLIGVIGIHLLTGEKFSIYTAVGLVVLVGVVVNNGIVLVDYANLLRNRNMSIFDATVMAGGNRLRPILMTTLTTVLGLLPMAFFKGEGTDLSQPLAKTMLGGLTVSTFFTLFLIPTIYSIFSELTEKRKIKKDKKRERQLENRKKRLAEKIVIPTFND